MPNVRVVLLNYMMNLMYANVSNVSYYCETNSHIKQLVHAHYANLDQQVDLLSLQSLQVEQANLISEVSIKVDDLNLRNNELRSEVDKASELISTDKPPIIPTESPSSRFQTVAEELGNREHRKNNVIIYKLVYHRMRNSLLTSVKESLTLV